MTATRRPWHQVAPLPDGAGYQAANAHFAAAAYAHLLALGEGNESRTHARAFEAAYVAASSLGGRTWPNIRWGLEDGERAAQELHALLRWVDIDPDQIAPARDDQC